MGIAKNIESFISRIKTGFCDDAGYTLITTAIVIVALGVVVTALAGVYFIYERKQSLIETENNMSSARDALERHINMKGHLPCPAPLNASMDNAEFNRGKSSCTESQSFSLMSDGVASVTGRGGRTVHIGALPTRTLGIGDQHAVDGYGKRIVYAVTASYTDPASAEFSKANGAIDMRTQKPDGSWESVLSVDGSAIYTIISPGLDDRGAYTLDGVQVEPCDASSFAGGNCTFDNAVFHVSMNRTFGIGDETYTNTFYYRAALDVYKWKVEYQNCTCHRTFEGEDYFKTKEPAITCVGADGVQAPDEAYCKSAKPDDTPVDCSGEDEVADCFEWAEVWGPWGECSSSCERTRTSTFECVLKGQAPQGATACEAAFNDDSGNSGDGLPDQNNTRSQPAGLGGEEAEDAPCFVWNCSNTTPGQPGGRSDGSDWGLNFSGSNNEDSESAAGGEEENPFCDPNYSAMQDRSQPGSGTGGAFLPWRGSENAGPMPDGREGENSSQSTEEVTEQDLHCLREGKTRPESSAQKGSCGSCGYGGDTHGRGDRDSDGDGVGDHDGQGVSNAGRDGGGPGGGSGGGGSGSGGGGEGGGEGGSD